MHLFRNHRLSHLLAAALALIWPAGIASACCCAAKTTSTRDEGCGRGCCAAESSACCSVPGSDDGKACCTTAAERHLCGCLSACEGRAVRRELNLSRHDSWRVFGDAWPSAGWSDLRPQSPESVKLAAGGGEIPSRSVRILYGVWRN